jgi:hypothetical protein
MPLLYRHNYDNIGTNTDKIFIFSFANKIYNYISSIFKNIIKIIDNASL